MRLALPDLQHEEQVHQTGIALINLFGADLFKYIDSELEKSDGKDWLTTYRKSNLVYANYNFVDPSNLLKELLRVSTSPLRKPIRRVIDNRDSVSFFNRLNATLGDEEVVHAQVSRCIEVGVFDERNHGLHKMKEQHEQQGHSYRNEVAFYDLDAGESR